MADHTIYAVWQIPEGQTMPASSNALVIATDGTNEYEHNMASDEASFTTDPQEDGSTLARFEASADAWWTPEVATWISTATLGTYDAIEFGVLPLARAE